MDSVRRAEQDHSISYTGEEVSLTRRCGPLLRAIRETNAKLAAWMSGDTSRSQERLARSVRGEREGSLQMANTAKTAIITGASRGIGAGLVEAFLKRGYNVVANSRNITKTNTFAAGANVALVDGDIGQPSTAARIMDTAVSRFGRIDVLINNAGVFIPKPFTEYTTEDFDTLVSTTLGGFLYVSQLAVKQMLRHKSGSIINISTTLVDQPTAGVGAAAQIMLKGALNAVTRALAIEYAKEGIRVNTIAPGVINTPMHGEVKETVDAALFLTEATFTSGEILHADERFTQQRSLRRTPLKGLKTL